MSPIGRLLPRMRTTFLCLALILALPSAVLAEDYSVSSPLELQNALNEAAINGEDDTITIAAGTYAGSFHFDPHEAHSLLLRGAVTGDPVQVVLEGQASPARAALGMSCGPAPGARVTVRDLTLQNGYDAGFKTYCAGGAIALTLERVVAQHNTAIDNGGGVQIEAAGPASITATLLDCVIRDNEAPGRDGRGGRGGGLRAEASGGGARVALTVVNGMVTENRSNWPGGGVSLTAQGPPLDNELQATLVHTTITGNRSGMHGTPHAGGGLALYARPEGITNTLTLYNTVLYGNEAGAGAPGDDLFLDVSPDAVGTVEAFYSDVGEVEIFSGGSYTPEACISADPLFRNASAGDLHLTDGSPCIDRGTTTVPDPPGLPAMDMDGQPRVYGAAPDIGADEYGGGVMLWLPVILKRTGR